MLSETFFEQLKEKAKSYFEEGGSHEFSHTERVYNNTLLISKEENADLDIVKAAALLHDIAREKEDNGKCECHAKEGAIMAEKILEEMNFPKDKISKVTYAIRVHRHSTGITPETIEAAILQDADRLDALGAMTIARMFSTGGKIGIPLHDPKIEQGKTKGYSNTVINGFNSKILKITPETFNTESGKEMAKDRYKFVQDFLERFIKEWECEEK